MRKIIILNFCIIILALISCSHIPTYHAPIQQGNIITDDVVKKVKYGMSKAQVANILGDPVLTNPFDNNTWSYVYTLRPSKGPVKQKQLIIYFTHNLVSNISVDLPPPTLPSKKLRR